MSRRDRARALLIAAGSLSYLLMRAFDVADWACAVVGIVTLALCAPPVIAYLKDEMCYHLPIYAMLAAAALIMVKAVVRLVSGSLAEVLPFRVATFVAGIGDSYVSAAYLSILLLAVSVVAVGNGGGDRRATEKAASEEQAGGHE